MAGAVGGDSYLAVAAVGYVLADREAETGALYEFVEFDETFKDACLLFLGDAGTGVQTIEQ